MNYLYLILALLHTFIRYTAAGEDYYQLLGIARTATNDQIRKAFRKLAIKYHPDKNKNDPEHAKQIFAKIANAYDILSDPEKRKIYDQYGEEGIKKPNEYSQGNNFEGFWNGFFGGQRFQFNMGGNGRGHHNFGFDNDEFSKRKSLFENTEVFNLEMSTISKFYRRQEIWYIYFYKPEDKEHLSIGDKIVKLAAKSEGAFIVSSLNCAESEELCEDFAVYDTPKLILYKSSYNEEPIQYKKEYDVDEMWKLAVSFMMDFLDIINENTFEDFMNRYPGQIKVLYFASEMVSPLIKLMSSEYRGFLHFGLIRSSEKTLLEKFKVNNFPTLMIINDTEAEGVKYTEEFTKDRLNKFLRKFKYEKLKTPTNLLRKLSKTLWNTGRCGSGDNKMCFLLVLKNENDNTKDLIKKIIPRYEYDPIDFYYVILNEEADFIQAFPKFEQERDQVILFKSYRRKYGVLEGELSEDRLLSFIDSVLAGSLASFPVKERYLDIKSR